MTALLSLGHHHFSILPMSYQKLKTDTSIHLPAIARFGGDDARQFTGRPSAELTIDGLLFPKEFGGKGAYDAIRATQYSGTAVMMVGFSGSVGRAFGRVIIQKVSDTQSEIDIDGTGKMVSFSVQLTSVGGSLGGPGGLF